MLGIKGVIEVVEPESDEEEDKAGEGGRGRGLRAGARRVWSRCAGARASALGQILSQRLDEIEQLASEAEAAPGRKPEAIKARLAEQIAALLETSDRFDPDRLQSGSDPDRRQGRHPRGARPPRRPCRAGARADRQGRPGRAQARFPGAGAQPRSQHLCAKSNDLELTNIGLELKNVVEQFREQVQNLE